ncbi:MAG: hypothetical protein CL675_05290 [Bdellovibrionaceae bacterium]|nr:hypothetical protein [Pseudobdellovibrionaceae bacterium]
MEIDEFEFKPLTDGLGFHKKNQAPVPEKKDWVAGKTLKPERPLPPSDKLLRSQQREPQAESAENTKKTIEDLLSALDRPVPATNGREAAMSVPEVDLGVPAFDGPDFTEPLPRADDVPAREAYRVPATEMPAGIQLPKEVAKPTAETGTRRSGHGGAEPKYRESTLSVTSMFLDVMTTAAVTILFLISMILATNIDVFSIFRKIPEDIYLGAVVGTMFLSVWFMYVVIARSFCGRTLGEWTFDLQLGTKEQQAKALYPLQVVWRSLFVMATGVVVLPLLSVVFRKDLAKVFTGLQLYKVD